MRAVLLAILLSGCASGPCLFGAERAQDAQGCAVRNFGEAGESEFRERTATCNAICGENREWPWCAVNCEGR